ncbi:MAG: hypothetical protein U9N09_04320 [Euryarchaeota archaeon]|nr:hypothetical protein [Euryarchaeota archaeon]
MFVYVDGCGGCGRWCKWDVCPGAGTLVQDAIGGAVDGGTIYVHAGTHVDNVNMGKCSRWWAMARMW